jgi:hypothetical protein
MSELQTGLVIALVIMLTVIGLLVNFHPGLKRYYKIQDLLKEKKFLQDRAEQLLHEHGLMCMMGYYAGIPSEQRPKVAEKELKRIRAIEKELDKLEYTQIDEGE